MDLILRPKIAASSETKRPQGTLVVHPGSLGFGPSPPDDLPVTNEAPRSPTDDVLPRDGDSDSAAPHIPNPASVQV